MSKKFLNISTDTTLGGNSPADDVVSSQKAVKDYIDSQSIPSGMGRNVGDIFFTSRLDSALNGAVECNGGTYDTGNYSGAQSIGALLANGSIPYVSLSQYATLLSTNGSVGVFGWDGTGTTTFRVPTLTDIFVETGTAAQIGDYIAPGAPDITGAIVDAIASEGAFYNIGEVSSSNSTSGGSYDNKVGFKASNSSPVYGNSNTIQPNTVRYRAMVQLVLSATDAAVATCTSVTSQVAANTSAINTLDGYDYVVESQLPTAQNNHTWYRRYKSGWVEQGGYINAPSASANYIAVSLPIEMANNNYQILKLYNKGANQSGTNNFIWVSSAISSQQNTTTTVNISVPGSSYVVGCFWEVKGMSAQ